MRKSKPIQKGCFFYNKDDLPIPQAIKMAESEYEKAKYINEVAARLVIHPDETPRDASIDTDLIVETEQNIDRRYIFVLPAK